MDESNMIRLGSILHMEKGKKPRAQSKRSEEGYLPYINIKAFEQGIIEKYATTDKVLLCKDGDLLIVCDGSRSGLTGYATKGVVGSTLSKISADGVHTKYLNYFIQSKYTLLNTRKKGTGTPHLNAEILKSSKLLVPSISEQERIVSRIEELFSLLDTSVAELKTAKERLRVYRQAVVTATYPPLTAENTCCLSEIAEITGGITKGRKFENSETIFLPYLRVANVQNGYLDLTEIKQIQLKKSEIEQYLLHFGDVLYTEGGDRDKLGRGTIWRNEIENCVHQNHIFKARIDSEKVLPLYAACWSMTMPARNYFYAKGKQSVNLASINKTVLSALPIPLVSIEQQKKIVTEVEAKLSVCDSIEKAVDTALQQAGALRQSILKRAFEGGL